MTDLNYGAAVNAITKCLNALGSLRRTTGQQGLLVTLYLANRDATRPEIAHAYGLLDALRIVDASINMTMIGIAKRRRPPTTGYADMRVPHAEELNAPGSTLPCICWKCIQKRKALANMKSNKKGQK